MKCLMQASLPKFRLIINPAINPADKILLNSWLNESNTPQAIAVIPIIPALTADFFIPWFVIFIVSIFNSLGLFPSPINSPKNKPKIML